MIELHSIEDLLTYMSSSDSNKFTVSDIPAPDGHVEIWITDEEGKEVKISTEDLELELHNALMSYLNKYSEGVSDVDSKP